jgi:hypothetical protein
MSDSMGCSAAYSELAVPANEATDKTTKVLAWLFGALFASTLLALAYVLFVHVPNKLKLNQMDETSKETDFNA